MQPVIGRAVEHAEGVNLYEIMHTEGSHEPSTKFAASCGFHSFIQTFMHSFETFMLHL